MSSIKGAWRLIGPLSIKCCTLLLLTFSIQAANISATHVDPLPSWHDNATKKTIIEFVQSTTQKGSSQFVPLRERIVTFDQDGTTWVEQPLYTQINFALDQILDLASQHPEWNTTEPFKTVIQGDKQAIAKLSLKDLEKIFLVTHSGVSVEEFKVRVRNWLQQAKHPRWNRPYTELVYQPMLELIHYLQANGYKTYIVTGGGQDFVRAYAEEVYNIPPDQIIGSALGTEYAYDKAGKAILIKTPKLLLNNNFSGKPEDIYLMIGRRPSMAVGNSTGDRQMLEYAQSGNQKSLLMLVLHDDEKHEYAYGPAEGLPDTKIGTFNQALYDEAIHKGWHIISMKKDWKIVFPFEKTQP
jgi:phosphoglycolate phosphatase-like HAD superfamily hydrolase